MLPQCATVTGRERDEAHASATGGRRQGIQTPRRVQPRARYLAKAGKTRAACACVCTCAPVRPSAKRTRPGPQASHRMGHELARPPARPDPCFFLSDVAPDGIELGGGPRLATLHAPSRLTPTSGMCVIVDPIILRSLLISSVPCQGAGYEQVPAELIIPGFLIYRASVWVRRSTTSEASAFLVLFRLRCE